MSLWAVSQGWSWGKATFDLVEKKSTSSLTKKWSDWVVEVVSQLHKTLPT